MGYDVEVVLNAEQSKTARTLMRGLIDGARTAGLAVTVTEHYAGAAPWLVLWGVGRAEFMVARKKHLATGGRLIHWDMGYIGRGKVDAHCRVSIDDFHPWRWLDRTPSDPSRLAAFDVRLREDASPAGPVVLACMGPKSLEMLQVPAWNDRAAAALRARFPGVTIVRREKPKSRYVDVPPIEQVLRGARLLVCRHSNCAIDAAIAGVPFECEDGAAYWLAQREFTPENRLDFLRRLCWWQWRHDEAPLAWEFIKEMLCD